MVLIVCAKQDPIAEGNVLVACDSQSAECTVSVAAPFYDTSALTMRRCDAERTVDFCNGDDCLCVHIQGDTSRVGTRREDGRLIVHQATQRFRVELRDTAFNNYIAQGQLGMWSAWLPPSSASCVVRHGSKRHLAFYDENEGYYSKSFLPGRRRDCNVEECPTRWENCFSAHQGVEMLQIQVLVFLERRFCNHFADISTCIEYVRGVFRDANLIFDRQIGVHLVMAYVIPPDVLDRLFPLLSQPVTTDPEEYLSAMNNYFVDSSCETTPVFRSTTGFEHSQFGLVHVFTNAKLEVKNSGSGETTKGYGTLLAMCDCKRKGAWTSYQGDREGDETWRTFAHEVGHNFGARHYWESRGIPQNEGGEFGMMDYGDGRLNGIYQFDEVHRSEICVAIQNVLQDQTTAAQPGCFRPFYEPAEKDERAGISDFTLILSIVSISFTMVLLCVAAVVFYLKSEAYSLKYEKLSQELKKCRGSLSVDPEGRTTHETSDSDDKKTAFTAAFSNKSGTELTQGSAAPPEESREVDTISQNVEHQLSTGAEKSAILSGPVRTNVAAKSRTDGKTGNPGRQPERSHAHLWAANKHAQRPVVQGEAGSRQADSARRRPAKARALLALPPYHGDASQPRVLSQEPPGADNPGSQISEQDRTSASDGVASSTASRPYPAPLNFARVRTGDSTHPAPPASKHCSHNPTPANQHVSGAPSSEDNYKPTQDLQNHAARRPLEVRTSLASPGDNPATRPASDAPRSASGARQGPDSPKRASRTRQSPRHADQLPRTHSARNSPNQPPRTCSAHDSPGQSPRSRQACHSPKLTPQTQPGPHVSSQPREKQPRTPGQECQTPRNLEKFRGSIPGSEDVN